MTSWGLILTDIVSQGPIYQRIIADVIENSQVDFEESGVDRATLEELREVSATVCIFELSLRCRLLSLHFSSAEV